MHDIDRIFKCYYRPLCLYAIHYLQDVDAAEDVVQECFTRLIERGQTGQRPENVRGYLYASVRNACVDMLRKGQSFDCSIQPQDLDERISDEETIERSAHEAELWAAIDCLPSKRKQVLLMAKRDNMTYQAISEILKISEKTVGNHISRALKALRVKFNLSDNWGDNLFIL